MVMISVIVMEATKELLGEFLLRLEGDSSRDMEFNDLALFWTNASTLRLLTYETRSPHLNTLGSSVSLIA